jgi:serine/threonine protein kinase
MDKQGRKLGNYQVEHLLGSGAFADVYLGQHIYLNTSAAIKILQTRLGENDLQSFLGEARTVAGLTHPNIIRVLEFGVEEQTPYLVMEYAPAGTLRQSHPRPARLTVSKCITYMNQVASALQYAHDHRVIHRDVKPENMLIGPHEQLLLSDFGIAVAAQSSRYQGQQEFGGTAAYSSPEQIQGKASYASDQYALGIILYEWLTGELPFRGSFFEVCSQHLFKPAPSLLNKLPNLPPTIEQVYQRAVAKDSQQRFARVEDFAQALEMAGRGDDPTVLLKSGLSKSAAPSTPPSLSAPTEILMTPPASETTLSFPPPLRERGKNQAPPPLFQAPVPSAPLTKWQEKRSRATTVLLSILLVLLVVSGIWGYTRQVAGNNPIPTQGPTSQSTSDSANGSNAVDATPTPTSTPTPTPQPSVVVSDSTIQINKMLTCDNCQDPVHVKVDTVTVQNGNGRMIWTLTFTNVSGDCLALNPPTVSLHDSTAAQDFSPDSINGSLYDSGIVCDLDANANTDMSVIFTFLPYTQTTYTLSVEAQGFNIDVKFDPLGVTFS